MIRTHVYSRVAIETAQVADYVTSAWISVADPTSELPKRNPRKFYDYISLRFADLDGPLVGSLGFNESQARALARFILDCVDNEVSDFYINCVAGLSRSAGIATAIEVFYNQSGMDKYPLHNQHVRALLLHYLRQESQPA